MNLRYLCIIKEKAKTKYLHVRPRVIWYAQMLKCTSIIYYIGTCIYIYIICVRSFFRSRTKGRYRRPEQKRGTPQSVPTIIGTRRIHRCSSTLRYLLVRYISLPTHRTRSAAKRGFRLLKLLLPSVLNRIFHYVAL